MYSFGAIVVIAANTMNGPGLTTLPEMASDAGRVVFGGLVIVAALTTSFVVHKLCDLMWKSHKDEMHHDSGQTVVPSTTITLPATTTTTTTATTTTTTTTSSDRGRPRLDDSDIVALADELYGRKKLVSLLMIGCALSLSLAQMMLCAAISDSMIVAATGQSCGYSPTTFRTHCTSNLSMKPFLIPSTLTYNSDGGTQRTDTDNDGRNIKSAAEPIAYPPAPVSLISMGLMVSSTITISLAAVDLDSMIMAQYVLFACLLFSCGRFCMTLHNMELLTSETTVASTQVDEVLISPVAAFWVGARPFNAVGPVLFNFAFVVTAPPLSCGADNGSVASRALIVACIVMGILYTAVGYIGATAALNTPRNADGNLLSIVLRGTDPDALDPVDMWSVVLFGLSQLAAIPVYCELARQTLLGHMQVRNKQLAFGLSHVLPWTVVAMTYNSELFEAFVEWSSLLLLGFSNFSLPLLLHHKHTVVDDQIHHRRPRPGLNTVVWGLAVITASIAAVIVQQVTNSMLLAELVFIGSCAGVLYNVERTVVHDHRSHHESSSSIELTQ